MLDQIQARDDQLQQHRDELESLVVQRTVELARTNAQLEDVIVDLKGAKAMAEDANHTKSQSLASIVA